MTHDILWPCGVFRANGVCSGMTGIHPRCPGGVAYANMVLHAPASSASCPGTHVTAFNPEHLGVLLLELTRTVETSDILVDQNVN